jgi:hypothetical protein
MEGYRSYVWSIPNLGRRSLVLLDSGSFGKCLQPIVVIIIVVFSLLLLLGVPFSFGSETMFDGVLLLLKLFGLFIFVIAHISLKLRGEIADGFIVHISNLLCTFYNTINKDETK